MQLRYRERIVYKAITKLNGQKRSTNNSQIASATLMSRGEVRQATDILKAYGYIKDVGKGQAYNWRVTGKELPPAPASEPGPSGLAKMFPLGPPQGQSRSRHALAGVTRR